jgi:large repetitive protein
MSAYPDRLSRRRIPTVSAHSRARLAAVEALERRVLLSATLTTLASFDGGNGDSPEDGLTDVGGKLYGTTYYGGADQLGTVFELSTDTSTLSTLLSFSSFDGAYPFGGLVTDDAGNLYGTTHGGGENGDGTVFEVSADTHALTTIASFNGTNGQAPDGALFIDAAGNLYGTTPGHFVPNGGAGDGTVFEVSAASGSISTLVTFNGNNGAWPLGGLIADATGNLYGVTAAGGVNQQGTVFEISAHTHALTTLGTFDGANGDSPNGNLVADASGNLYGTAITGGNLTLQSGLGDGTVFEVPAGGGSITTLASFNGSNGDNPASGLIADAEGNLFGTSQGGESDDGTVFEVAAGSGSIATVASFNGTNGIDPSSLISDKAGNLYGTTSYGGASKDGTIFELSGGGFAVAPKITSSDGYTFTGGYTGSFTVTTNGSPTPTLSESGVLPTGVTFRDNGDGTATISGTPAAGTTGTYVLTLTATNGAVPNSIKSFTVTVGQAPAITSASTTNFITGTTGSFTISSTGFPTDALSESGALPSGMTFIDNGDGTATLSGAPAAGTAGAYVLMLKAKNGSKPNAKQSFTLNVDQSQAPAITSAGMATFTAGTVGSFTVTTTGLPTAALTENGALPSGISFTDNGNGTATLSGTPEDGTGGTYVLALKAKNGTKPNGKQGFTLTVDQTPAITSLDTFTFTISIASKFTVTTTGFPTAIIAETGVLPNGITFIDKGNGNAKLRGTPAAGTAGTYPITLKAHNSVKPKATQSFTLVVTDPIPGSNIISTINRLDTGTGVWPAVDAIILSSADEDTLVGSE